MSLRTFISRYVSNFWFNVVADGSEGSVSSKNKLNLGHIETSHGMEIAQLLLSLLHAWGMDNDLDKVCKSKLGLLRPLVSSSIILLVFRDQN